jgi:MFS family permease
MLTALMFIQPSISIHIKEHGFEADKCALLMGLTAFSFGIISPFVHELTKVVPKRGVLLAGQIFLCASILMICNTSLLPGFEKSTAVMLCGIGVLGIAAGLIMIPALPEMMDTIEFDEEFCNTYDQKDIETVISSVFVTFHSIGEAVGPITNSIMITSFGFVRAHEYLAFYIFCFIVMYFMLCGHVVMFIKRWDPEFPRNSKENGDKIETELLIK